MQLRPGLCPEPRWGSLLRWPRSCKGCFVGSPVISATSHLGDSQVGDKPTRRQPTQRHEWSTRRQFISFECLFRIHRTKQVEQESRAIAGKPCDAAVNFEYELNEWTRKTFQHLWSVPDGAEHDRRPTPLILFKFLLLLLRLQQVPTVGVFLFLTHRLECSVGMLYLEQLTAALALCLILTHRHSIWRV